VKGLQKLLERGVKGLQKLLERGLPLTMGVYPSIRIFNTPQMTSDGGIVSASGTSGNEWHDDKEMRGGGAGGYSTP
jgi:hypothetical protein